MAFKVLFALTIALALVSGAVCSTDGKTVEGYKFGSDAQKYVEFGKDACDISDAMSAKPPAFATAKEIYQQGKNAKNSGYTGSLQTFAKTDFSSETYWKMYSDFFGKDPQWLDTFMMQALNAVDDFKAAGEDGRAEGVEKIAKDNIMVSLTLHELNTVTLSMAQGKYGDKDGAPHAFDEAFAAYAGNPSCGPYNLANTYAPIFGTIKDCATNASIINSNIVTAFVNGRAAAKKKDSAGVKDSITTIVRNIVAAHMQAVLKYAAELDNLAKAGKDTTEAHVEGYVYLRSIAPLIADKNVAVAKALYNLLDLPNTPKATTGYYEQVNKYFQSVYSDFGITEDLIGMYNKQTSTSSCPKKNSAAVVTSSLAAIGVVAGAVALLL